MKRDYFRESIRKVLRPFLIIFIILLFIIIGAVIEVVLPWSSQIIRGLLLFSLTVIYFYVAHRVLKKSIDWKVFNKRPVYDKINHWLISGSEFGIYEYLEKKIEDLKYDNNDYLLNLRNIEARFKLMSQQNLNLLLADLKSREKNDTYVNIIIGLVVSFLSTSAIWVLRSRYEDINNVQESFINPKMDFLMDCLAVFLSLVLLIYHTVSINYRSSNKNRFFIEIIEAVLKNKKINSSTS